MTQKEQMLRFIKRHDVVAADEALSNRYGSSFTATLKELRSDDFVTLNKGFHSENEIVGHVSIPDTWHITSKGEAWLKDSLRCLCLRFSYCA